MFDKIKFANILKRINEIYDNQVSFAQKANVNRTYLSQYMNMKLDNPPSPKKLKGIADASRGITTYDELMEVCGHITEKAFGNNLIVNNDITSIPLFVSEKGTLIHDTDLWIERKILNPSQNYFAFKTDNDSMLPLLGTGDIAILEKTDSFASGQTCLFSIDNKDIMIRKIIDLQDHIELQTAFPYGQPMKLTKDEIKKRNFTILGRVIKVENQSAFK